MGILVGGRRGKEARQEFGGLGRVKSSSNCPGHLLSSIFFFSSTHASELSSSLEFSLILIIYRGFLLLLCLDSRFLSTGIDLLILGALARSKMGKKEEEGE